MIAQSSARTPAFCRTPLTVALLLLALFACTGCDSSGGVQLLPETEEKYYQRAQQWLREGRDQEALNAFLKVIEKRSEAPESHLEAGRIYLQQVKDPIAAIYHFRKYLELKPDSPQAPPVRQMIETAMKEFARKLPGDPFHGDVDRMDMTEMIKKLQDENLDLKNQLAASKQRIAQLERSAGIVVSSSGSVVATPRNQPQRTAPGAPLINVGPATQQRTPAPAAPAGRTYTVEAGDTLSKISTKVYGNPARWNDIFQANRDQLPTPHSLKVGQQLKVP